MLPHFSASNIQISVPKIDQRRVQCRTHQTSPTRVPELAQGGTGLKRAKVLAPRFALSLKITSLAAEMSLNDHFALL
jgi:hypothetical protein